MESKWVKDMQLDSHDRLLKPYAGVDENLKEGRQHVYLPVASHCLSKNQATEYVHFACPGGGVGKTTMLIEITNDYLQHASWEGGVIWVDMNGEQMGKGHATRLSRPSAEALCRR
eukprot:gnl/TRDRNA2_/TRDRNA2_213130_c0_seq1.p1 gnl/TRDRNA2_/TRDRNA2_213130_c0~~gnl/TRDRNA2_/TRDRNA2_213130_c0_seq1.p1  ORF type:complete len:115 (+),score=6.89 gnl/TRDRNA2_/TRDRNA2_213130_c0_seq1:36-380(+)